MKLNSMLCLQLSPVTPPERVQKTAKEGVFL